MKKTSLALIALLLMLLLGACQQIDLKKINPMDLIKKKKLPETTYFDPQTLEPTIAQAMISFEAAKMEKLNAFPYISIKQTTEINVTEYPADSDFRLKSQLITKYDRTPNGTVTLEFFSESEDQFGRRDLAMNTVVYTTRQPRKDEAVKLRQWALKTGRSYSERSEDSKQVLMNFQKESGLKPDGLYGRMSANALSEKISMIQIQTMQSSIFHPETLSHMIFILPYDLVSKNADKFNRGFDSLLEVGKHGLTADKFKTMAKPGEKFVLFAYFLDRIDPTAALRVGLASAEHRWSNTVSSTYYASPGSWPVIVETFSIDDTVGSSRLYANIFVKNGFAYKCIASHRLM